MGMAASDLSSTSPIDVGRILALSLDHSCRIEQISEQEQSLLADAKIPIEKYHRELLLLAGFANDYAILKYLGNSGVGKQVREGYLEVWMNMAKQNAAGAALFRAFVSRCPEYAKAAEAMEPGSMMNPISLAFSRFLELDNVTAPLLTLTYAPEMYWSHFENAVKVLQQATLIKSSGN
jgi:hypothetical protein